MQYNQNYDPCYQEPYQEPYQDHYQYQQAPQMYNPNFYHDVQRPVEHQKKQKKAKPVIVTEQLCQRIKHELEKREILQHVFAETVVGRTQGTLSELLNHPKPFEQLSTRRKMAYERMAKWLELDEVDKAAMLRKVIPVKQPRFRTVFSDDQLARLELEYSLDNYPSREQFDRMAAELQLGSQTVKTYFKNRRSKAKNEPVHNQYQQMGSGAPLPAVQHPSEDQKDPGIGHQIAQIPQNQMNVQKRSVKSRIPAAQRAQLEQKYTINQYPDFITKGRIAQELGLDFSQVKVFFKNRRAKDRK